MLRLITVLTFYGGSIENRNRFPLEIIDTVVDTIGADRVSIRLFPWSGFQDMEYGTSYETWGYLVKLFKKDILVWPLLISLNLELILLLMVMVSKRIVLRNGKVPLFLLVVTLTTLNMLLILLIELVI
jgi:hypothetical protein